MSSQSKCLTYTSFEFPGQTAFYKGKVRDVYTIGDKLIMVASDRISAFDHVLPKAIPYKGQVLNQIAAHFLRATEDIVPNWLMATPDPNVAVGEACEPFKVEMVIRGYLAGHAWRTYQAGGRILCGEEMPDGLKQNDPFPVPLITPTTKASEGHDEDISKTEILDKGIVSQKDWNTLERFTRLLYNRGQEMARKQGLILVDTKYEFGKKGENVFLIDEVHTPDSSRYFYLDGYEERQERGEAQKQLSKEFVREWLMANGFQGKDGQTMPEMPEDFVYEVSDRYIQLYELITGSKFEKANVEEIKNRVEQNVLAYLGK
ncbi:MAG: phosphoribosylaminoimidazolesuccinocarboxamide synthase [Saprospiraceae bacterium]|nr:phosphoribosylaminoimidazolesuccinocarboxamide synthase [Saprospiraceae bacterium]